MILIPRPDGKGVIERPGPLPAASIARRTAGWLADEAELFRAVMRHMDATYREIAGGGFKARPRVAGVLSPAVMLRFGK